MKPLLWTFIVSLLIFGCATSTKDLMPPRSEVLPPELDDDAIAQMQAVPNDQGKVPQNVRWWVSYQQGQKLLIQKSYKEACLSFLNLAQDPLFPLSDLALLRAHQSCQPNNPILAQIEFDPEDQPSWLKPVALDVGLERAKLRDDKIAVMNLSIAKSQLASTREKKTKHIQTAIRIAKNLDDEDLVARYTELLHNVAPRFIPTPKPDEYLKVALDFRRQRQFSKARAYYTKVLRRSRSTSPEKIAAFKGLRKTYKLQNNRKAYLRTTEQLAEYSRNHYRRSRKTKAEVHSYLSQQILLARTYWTMGHITAAKKILRSLPKIVGRRYSMAEVYWLRGRMMEEKQNFNGAVWWFDKALQQPSISTNLTQSTRWYKAWNLRKLKQYRRSAEVLEELRTDSENIYDKARYSFWLGKTYADASLNEKAEEVFNNLKHDDPLGYYGLLAHYETGSLLQNPSERELASTDLTLDPPGELDQVLNPVYLKWLVSVGEKTVAQSYLDHIANHFRKNSPKDEHVWLALLTNYAKAGNYLGLFIQLGQLESAQREAILSQKPDLIFPRPFQNEVSTAATKFGIYPELIYSIMRQESAFDPRARSHADAFGLMQLLPRVARSIASRSELPYRKANELYNPEINISLGAALIKSLLKKYDNQFVLAVASYNASEDAIRGWMQTRYRGNTLEFIEDIPYEETQGYVKLVMRNLVFYQLFDSSEPINFPTWALNLGSDVATSN